jgi:hypothetical protein
MFFNSLQALSPPTLFHSVPISYVTACRDSPLLVRDGAVCRGERPPRELF